MGDKPISFRDENGNFVSAADVWNAEKLEELFNTLNPKRKIAFTKGKISKRKPTEVNRLGEYYGKTIHTDKAPAAIGPYVQGKIVGNLLFASGQVPLSPETGEIIGETIQEQTEQVLKNIGAILEEAGTDFDHVVKTTCFLSDMNDFVPFNEVYKTVFTTEFPARSAC